MLFAGKGFEIRLPKQTRAYREDHSKGLKRWMWLEDFLPNLGRPVTLSKAKEQEAQTHALDLAVKDANSKAKTIADAMEAKLVGPTSVSLGYSYMPNMPIRMESNTAQPAPIQLGQLEYTVNVQITYAFS